MDGPYTATCSCGEIGITVAGPPDFQAVCSCRDCQERTGTAFGMSVYFPKTQVVEKTGNPRVYTRTSNRDRPLDFRFCPTCGTSVWWEVGFNPDIVGIAAILLDGFDFEPEFAVWTQSLPDFVTLPDGLREHRRGSMDD